MMRDGPTSEEQTPTTPARAPFARPVVEEMGRLDTMTLQQSARVGPGGFLPDPERTRRLG